MARFNQPDASSAFARRKLIGGRAQQKISKWKLFPSQIMAKIRLRRSTRKMMHSKLLFSALLLTLPMTSTAQVWATAVARNEAEDTAIVYRYVKEFLKDFTRSEQPDRIIVVWRYQGNKGMPLEKEQAKMDELEDALAPMQEDGFSTLAIVSTGNNLKEWTYYARNENEFFQRLNEALHSRRAFPIEIYAAPDPSWTTYEQFSANVKQ